MARRGDLLAVKGAWQLCRYLLQISETEELQQIEHDLREKLFLLYITSEFEGDIDFVLLKSLLLENDRLQYGLIVLITWLALLRSIVSPFTPRAKLCLTIAKNEDYGSSQIRVFNEVFSVADEPVQFDIAYPSRKLAVVKLSASNRESSVQILE